MKRKITWLFACLMLAACFIIGTPGSAKAASSTYTTITPYTHYTLSGNYRDKVGSRYFWTEYSGGNVNFRCATSSTDNGYVITTLSQHCQHNWLDEVSLVTNGSVAYYVTPGNALYKADLAKKTKTKLVSLTDTMKSRLNTKAVSVRAIACYGSLLYLGVSDDDFNTSETPDDEFIYTYNLSTKKFTRVLSGHFRTTNGRYLICTNNDDEYVYRYDMKYKKIKRFMTLDGGTVTAATSGDRFYIAQTGSNGSIREYTYFSLTCRTLVSDINLKEARCLYNKKLYYSFKTAKGNICYRRLDLSALTEAKLTKNTYNTAIYKAASNSVFAE